ncbi:hypothetical protein M0813_03917 [Anaeramoeba flamelloides]|uniref:Photosystem I assembly protein Ycf4 n=1 Tax=Anaeramoeba flamelloides TaxID=1746091 RepID=A0ABQ8XTY0_9EUKA|nr:hypothetical protein M0813_03917 [Anaeramoeba flamelloides]
MPLVEFLFWTDVLVLIFFFFFYNQQLKKQERISQAFASAPTNSDHLLGDLPSDLVSYTRSVITPSETVLLQTIPTAAELHNQAVSLLMYYLNGFCVFAGALFYFYSTYKAKEPSVVVYFIQLICNVSISVFCLLIINVKLRTLYILTDQKAYLFGNYRMRLSNKELRKVKFWDLDKLPEFTVYHQNNGNGDLIFDQEITNTGSTRFPTPVGFRYLHDIQKIEELVKNAIDQNQTHQIKNEKEKMLEIQIPEQDLYTKKKLLKKD